MAKNRAENKKICYLIIRYLVLFFSALGSLWIFYFIFTPLTVYPVFFLLKLIFSANLSGTVIIFNGVAINLIKSCIAGAAYYLLLILNLTTPMQVKKRILAILFSFSLFLMINIIRIFLFSLLLSNSFSLFNLTHLIVWYGLSSLIVLAVWIAEIKIFSIKEIPAYTDLKFLYIKIKNKKNG